MGRMILYGALVIGSFGLAAGGSYLMSPKEDPAEESEEKTGEDGEATEDATETAGDDEKAPAEPQPSAAPPRPMSAEDLYRIGEIMKAREEALKKREDALNEKDQRLKLILIDIDAEQRETDGLFTQVRGTLDSATQVLQQFQLEQQKAAPPAKEGKAGTAEEPKKDGVPTEAQMKGAKNIAVLWAAMPPEEAAKDIIGHANDAELTLVIQACSQIEPRKLSKIVSAIDDSTIRLDLIKGLASFKKPEKKAARR